MIYRIGQRVNLWQTGVFPGERLTRVQRSVVVNITEVKTGTPGEFSGSPVSLQSLRGMGDDGQIYEKHWDSWPESQTNDFSDQWSFRRDGHWIPLEAVSAYNRFVREGKERFKVVDRIVGPDGNDIIPKGDVLHCMEHDQYHHAGDQMGCFVCFLRSQGIQD